jgi:hypothetical protein
MRVEFYRNDEARIAGWDAYLGKRTHVPGSMMALGRGEISHDLAQYVIEATTSYRSGFWGLVAAGATFKSTGRRRTKPGRAVIAAHRSELAASEQLAGLHLAEWKQGRSTTVTAALSRAAAQFQALAPNERIVFTWPSGQGQVVGAGDPERSLESWGQRTR